MDKDQTIDVIKKIVFDLNETNLWQQDTNSNEYPSFRELRSKFLDDENEWRYFLKENVTERLVPFLVNLKKFSRNHDYISLNLLEASSKQILHSLRKEDPFFTFSPEILEDELKLKNELEPFYRKIKKERLESSLDYKIKKVEDLNLKLENKSKQLDEEYENVLKVIEDLKSKNNLYNELVDKDSNKELKNLYHGVYTLEITLADKYRNWALIIFAFVGLLLLIGFLNFSIQNWNHLRDSNYIYIPLGKDSLVKTLMLFSLTTPAWYLTRESTKHRKVAYKAQMLGTELASFPLYAREFKDEDRLELRKQLADRFFGQELYNDSKTVQNSDHSLEQIKLLTEANRVLTESLKVKKLAE